MTYAEIALGLVGFVAVASVATLALPRIVNVERSAIIDGSHANAILTMAASNTGYQRFNPYLSTDPDLKIETFGPESGIGSGFRFDGKEGKGSQIVAGIGEAEVNFEIDLGAMGKPTQAIRAEETGATTVVTWSMRADLGYNPIARVMGMFMDKFVGPTFERGLSNIEAEV